jgi:hypothetical protein
VKDRRKSAARNASRKGKKIAVKTKSARTSLKLPHIAELISDGEISIGETYGVGCVAAASDGHQTLAQLRRRSSESLYKLLARLDQAIAKAWDEDVFVDEIN